jgi:hypothetical protein
VRTRSARKKTLDGGARPTSLPLDGSVLMGAAAAVASSAGVIPVGDGPPKGAPPPLPPSDL